jgi:hypothetical protein
MGPTGSPHQIACHHGRHALGETPAKRTPLDSATSRFLAVLSSALKLEGVSLPQACASTRRNPTLAPKGRDRHSAPAFAASSARSSGPCVAKPKDQLLASHILAAMQPTACWRNR